MANLLTLLDYLTAHGFRNVAMECTGEYWKPIYNILEGNFDALLVNTQHLKTVRGARPKLKDYDYRIVALCLLETSFMPPKG